MITNYNLRKQILLFFLLLVSSFSFGQTSGSIDNSFLSEDRGSVCGVNSGSVVGNSSDESNIRCVSTQSDGKIIISGTFYKYDNNITPRIARLNPINGSLDITFNTPNINNYLTFSTVTNDDKIIVCGEFTEISGISYSKIARLNNDGTLDTSFNIGTGFNNIVTKAIIQDDGKIVVIGSFTEFNGVSRNSIARLNSDRILDATFNIGTGVVYGIEQERIYDITIQNDGKLIITGSFLTFNGVASWLIARLNTNGSLDNTFLVNTGANYGPIRCVESQNDGKIVISGGFTSYNGIPINQLARLNTNGSLDTTFNISGVTSANFTPAILDIVVQNDNKVILCGGLETINGITKNKIVRLNSDGTIDNSFNIGTGFLQIDGYDINWGMQSLKILSNGKIIVVGGCAFYNGTIRKSLAVLNSEGSLDNVFNASYGADAWVMDSKVLNDGKILISGGFNTYYQTPKSKIAKLNSNGTVDNSFNPPSTPNTFIRSFAIQSDNKILITRNSSTFIDNIYAETGKIERLNSDGTLDNLFETSNGANNVISKVVLENNKIYVVGNFTTYNGVNRNRIVRINLDGSIDSSFNVGIGPDSGVLDIIILSDGKLLISGNFNTINGITRRRIARLNSNGTLDTSFSGPFLSNSVNSIAIQDDGKIVLGTFLGLKRLNINGTNDSTFSISIPGLTIFKVVVQTDGKILAGGLQNNTEKRFYKFNNDATINTDFDTGIGITDGIVSTISVEANGKIIVGGDFRSYGVSKDRIIRVNNTIEALSTNTYSNKEFSFYPNPTNSIVHISATNEIINQINVYDMFGRLLKSQKGINDSEKINIQELPNAIYLLEVKTDKGTKTVKIVKQ